MTSENNDLESRLDQFWPVVFCTRRGKYRSFTLQERDDIAEFALQNSPEVSFLPSLKIGYVPFTVPLPQVSCDNQLKFCFLIPVKQPFLWAYRMASFISIAALFWKKSVSIYPSEYHIPTPPKNDILASPTICQFCFFMRSVSSVLHLFYYSTSVFLISSFLPSFFFFLLF